MFKTIGDGVANPIVLMSNTGSTVVRDNTIELSPSYRLPLFLLVGAIPLFWLQVWLGGAIALFAVFLSIQTATLRLVFTETALDVYRGKTLIRHFPYEDWQNWRVFWPGVPILFYFKEVKSIHFLPIIFDPEALKDCLQPLPRI